MKPSSLSKLAGADGFILVTDAEALRALASSAPAKRRTQDRNHGTRTPERHAWDDLRQRCLNPRHRLFGSYGGRGIRVSVRWATFAAFLADMGPRPTPLHTLDRIDNDGNYEPGNCRWATRATQQSNRRTTVLLTHRGETLCVAEWARRTGIPTTTLRERLRSGWSSDRALTTPAYGAGRGRGASKGLKAGAEIPGLALVRGEPRLTIR